MFTEGLREPLTDEEYAALAGFRYELRLFLRTVGEAAEAAGITPQQHQALLAIRSRPQGGATIGWVADQMLIQPNSASELVGRLEALELIVRTVPDSDRRRAELALTGKGRDVLGKTSTRHRTQVLRLKPMLHSLLDQL